MGLPNKDMSLPVSQTSENASLTRQQLCSAIHNVKVYAAGYSQIFSAGFCVSENFQCREIVLAILGCRQMLIFGTSQSEHLIFLWDVTRLQSVE